MDAHAQPSLLLEVGDHAAEVVDVCSIGRDAANDFVFGSELSSRHHARIEQHNKDFYLVDCSTNGTFVQTEDEQVTHVHRDKFKLWGAGWISLGDPLNVGQPIYFRQA